MQALFIIGIWVKNPYSVPTSQKLTPPPAKAVP
jgi:hypothetical protein